MAGLYVHIPFCKSRCVYCGFYSTTLASMSDRYVDALMAELRLRERETDGKWQTVYLGGGTPSTLGPRLLERLFSVIDCTSAAEVTIECNPDDVDSSFASFLSSLPVNRVSMGAQTFNDARLRFLRRRHKADDVARAVDCLRHAGIGNISVDLMFGFPDETLADWQSDINSALALDVDHISAYSLMYEEGTPLFSMLENGQVAEADEELTRAMYYCLKDRLEAAGYEHYEVSNFARPGRRSRHNSSYWSGVPYVGLGAAAHSFDGNNRKWNIDDLSIYINKVEKGIVPSTLEQLSTFERYNDMVMLSLRTSQGLDLSAVGRVFGESLLNYCLAASSGYVQSGLLVVESGRMRLTRSGLYVSDMVMADLMKV